MTRGIDLDAEVTTVTQAPNYQRRFTTQHKNCCTVARFSPDGRYVATGSVDTSIKLLEVEKMVLVKAKSDFSKDDDTQLGHPVVKNFYDHNGTINDIDFHPSAPLLASCASDCKIKLYDHNSSVKKALKQFHDTHNIRSIHFHPCGDYLLASGEHTSIRLWDVNSEKAYISPRTELNHFGAINMVRYSSDGKLYASCSVDGSIKFWDGITNDCINTITNAHGGREVSSIQFSRNRKYLLTGGKDAMIRIWDVIGGGRQIRRIFTGKQAQCENHLQVCFSYNEDFIFATDESTNSVVAWDTRTGESVQRLTSHTALIRAVASSPVKPHVMSCSDDHSARFWVEESLDNDLVMGEG